MTFVHGTRTSCPVLLVSRIKIIVSYDDIKAGAAFRSPF